MSFSPARASDAIELRPTTSSDYCRGHGLLMDYTTGQILTAGNEHQQRNPCQPDETALLQIVVVINFVSSLLLMELHGQRRHFQRDIILAGRPYAGYCKYGISYRELLAELPGECLITPRFTAGFSVMRLKWKNGAALVLA